MNNNLSFPYGTIVEAPAGFVPPEAWPEYGDIATPPQICAREEVGTTPRGIRWSLWPLCFEKYASDQEPDLAASARGKLARHRVVTWLRIGRHDVPLGWRQPTTEPWRIDGFAVLSPGQDYTKRWQKNVRREVQLWRSTFLHSHYIIETISIEEFTNAYKKSTIAKKNGLRLLSILQHKCALSHVREHVALWGVREVESKKIIAGLAAIYSPTYGFSVQECSFILPEARKVYAATGLVDHWYKESLQRGVTMQLFTYFWKRGESKTWKGFSEYKSHFGLTYVAYPPVLTRFVWGRLL